MIRKGALGVLLIAMATVCGGCWDRREINDIALVMASSIDLEKDGSYSGSVQIAVPARQIGNTQQKAKQFFVESGTGFNVQQLIQKEQPKLSREMFVSHRRVLFIGEKLARNGLKDILDHFSRNSTTRLRTFVLVVKGGEGKDALNTDYPLEFVPTEAVREMENLVGGTAVTMRDLFIAASGGGIQPILGVIELTESSGEVKGKSGIRRTFNLSGTAVFKDLKLTGFLDNHDTQYMLWVTGKLKKGMMTVQLPEQKKGVSVRLTEAKRTIDPSIEGGKVKFAIHLKGKGTLDENGTHLDFTNPKNLHLVEKELQKLLRKRVYETIVTVQKKYESDIFGFGELIHKKNKKEWRKIEKHWDKTFAEAQFIVDAEFVITRAGMSGPPLHLREREVIK